MPTHGSRDPNYYRALNLNDRVYWGEVCPHGNQLYEDKQRQQGNICVNLASPAIFEPDNAPDVEHEFSEGDAVVIIDCQSFVPEYMPVIRAYEQQKNEILPFNDGLLLNLDASRPADLTNTVLGADAQNKAATEGVFQRSIFDKFGCGSLTNRVTTLPRHLIESLVDDMVLSSTILPLREIRQNATISQQMQAELVDLLLSATLDFGQLVNFIDSLRNPVHCTQGPPGTGKSYLGVQIVYALTIIRKYWMQQNKSVGTPPILVLSYKNHAADEFLSDLLKVTGTLLTGNPRLSNFYPGQNVQMVRMGNSGDPNLTQVRRVVIMHDSTMVYIRSQIDVHVCVQMRSIQRKILPNNAVIRTCRRNRVRSVNCRTFVELVNVLHEALLCFKVTRLTCLKWMWTIWARTKSENGRLTLHMKRPRFCLRLLSADAYCRLSPQRNGWTVSAMS